MPQTFPFQLITPEQTFFEGEAQQVIIPGQMGEFGVLAGHAPFISTLKPGIVDIDSSENKTRIAVLGGVAETTPERSAVLAEVAESMDGVTVESAKTRLDAAQKALKEATDDHQKAAATQDKLMAQTMLAAL